MKQCKTNSTVYSDRSHIANTIRTHTYTVTSTKSTSITTHTSHHYPHTQPITTPPHHTTSYHRHIHIPPAHNQYTQSGEFTRDRQHDNPDVHQHIATIHELTAIIDTPHDINYVIHHIYTTVHYTHTIWYIHVCVARYT